MLLREGEHEVDARRGKAGQVAGNDRDRRDGGHLGGTESGGRIEPAVRGFGQPTCGSGRDDAPDSVVVRYHDDVGDGMCAVKGNENVLEERQRKLGTGRIIRGEESALGLWQGLHGHDGCPLHGAHPIKRGFCSSHSTVGSSDRFAK